MSLILTKPQAKAFHSSMLSLRKVGGCLDQVINFRHSVTVGVGIFGRVVVMADGITPEVYDNQAAFAAAYGLTQTAIER